MNILARILSSGITIGKTFTFRVAQRTRGRAAAATFRRDPKSANNARTAPKSAVPSTNKTPASFWSAAATTPLSNSTPSTPSTPSTKNEQ